jgi:hypothetical protein
MSRHAAGLAFQVKAQAERTQMPRPPERTAASPYALLQNHKFAQFEQRGRYRRQAITAVPLASPASPPGKVCRV